MSDARLSQRQIRTAATGASPGPEPDTTRGPLERPRPTSTDAAARPVTRPADAGRRASPSGLIDGASVRTAPLGPWHTLVTFRSALRPTAAADLSATVGEEGHLPLRWTRLDQRDGTEDAAPYPSLFVALMGNTPPAESPRLTLYSEQATDTLEPDWSRSSVDLRTLLREELAGMDAGLRTEALAFLAAATMTAPEAGKLSFARDLMLARDALREPQPLRARDRGESQGLNIDAIHAVDDSAYWVRGWVADGDAPLVRLTLFSPEGHRVDLLDDAYRYPRPDLDSLFAPGVGEGFIAYVELPGLSRLDASWISEVQNAVGTTSETEAPAVERDLDATRRRILMDLEHDRDHRLIESQAFPALLRMQRRVAARAAVAELREYGRRPTTPEASVIVPLYRRIDFLEQQLAQFAHDPTFREKADLVYVLDSPEQGDELVERAAYLHELYGVPFRVALLRGNVGFAHANNIGAELAAGRLLVFLNSDVLPDRPGWLDRMVEAHDGMDGIGALGPKLLYEDDSLQHAGLYFQRTAVSGLWRNQHYFKGLHRHFAGAARARAVPAVTGACLMIRRALYRDLGGMEGVYVQGDYEDSDLCIRLLEEGLTNWYLPDAELYHLEGQSYPDSLRRLTRRYNEWLHTHLWGDAIAEVMQEARYTDAPALDREESS